MTARPEHSERVYLIEMVPTPARHERADDFEAIIDDHLAWVAAQQDAGLLLATGPLVDDQTGAKTGGGVFVVRATSAADAARWVAGDPQVIGGFKTTLIRAWMMRTTMTPLPRDVSTAPSTAPSTAQP